MKKMLNFLIASTFLSHYQLFANNEFHQNDFTSFLTKFNDFSALESAAAHGTIGYSIGLGYSHLTTPEETNPYTAEFFSAEADKNRSINFPKIWVTKGLFYPLDIGGSYGLLNESGISNYGGYIQWTIFEKFALPALALRYNYSKISGIKQTEIDTNKFEAITSWGFPYLTVFGSVARSDNLIQLKPTNPEALSLVSLEDHQSVQKVKIKETVSQIGLQLVPLNPLTKLTVAITNPGTTQQFYAAKIAVGM